MLICFINSWRIGGCLLSPALAAAAMRRGGRRGLPGEAGHPLLAAWWAGCKPPFSKPAAPPLSPSRIAQLQRAVSRELRTAQHLQVASGVHCSDVISGTNELAIHKDAGHGAPPLHAAAREWTAGSGEWRVDAQRLQVGPAATSAV